MNCSALISPQNRGPRAEGIAKGERLCPHAVHLGKQTCYLSLSGQRPFTTVRPRAWGRSPQIIAASDWHAQIWGRGESAVPSHVYFLGYRFLELDPYLMLETKPSMEECMDMKAASEHTWFTSTSVAHSHEH